MGKIRIYELAQRMGLENKDLLERLHDKGVEAKSHMSVVDEEVLKALAPAGEQSEPEEKVTFDEERISTGLIRRRRKAAPVEVATEKELPVAEEKQQSTPVVAEPVAQPEPVVSPVVEVVEKQVLPVEPVVSVDTKNEPVAVEPTPAVKMPSEEEVAAKAKVEPTQKPARVKEVIITAEPQKRPTRHTATIVTPAEQKQAAGQPSKGGAKILGRVQLPQSALRPEPGAKGAPRPAHKPSGGPGGSFKPGGAPGGSYKPGGAPGGPFKPGGAPGGARPKPQAGERSGGPGGPSLPKLPVAGDEPVDEKGRDQRVRNKKKKGRGSDYSATDSQLRGRRRDRMEVFEPEHGGKLRKGKKAQKVTRQTEITVPKAIKRKIRITDVISVGELAKRMGVKANDLIRELMRQGSMVTINHSLDFETAAILAADFNYEVENVAFDEVSVLGEDVLPVAEQEESGNLTVRPPVVTIMGHVDHGKTSLLDAIRSAKIAEGEAGGITQHIGAYDVKINDKTISFLDTPGHEAFTAMRSRGAQVTDIVVLVVAADDGVMPQTKEAINHAKAAGVPIIVAVNKIDKPGANPERVKQELTEFQMVPEEWGGDTIFVEVSAKKHINLDQLLEMILLQAEVLELRADPSRRGRGTIVEARLDKGRGAVATVLVQDGTLNVGDAIVAGLHYGRVRTMINDRGEQVKSAGPSIPVEVTGLQGVPEAGDNLHALETEKLAKEVAMHRQQKVREAEMAKSSKLSLDQLYARIKEGNVEELKVIVKADVQGSVEAVKDALVKLSTGTCRLTIVHTAVGGITESDVSLATASDAIIIGFSVRPEPKAAMLAEKEGVDIRLYSIIYDAVADIKDAMEGLLAPTLREKHLGRVEVRETFNVSKVGTIAGCMVTEGKVHRHAQVRLVRDNIVVWEGALSSLKRFKDDAKEVATGYECGIGLEKYNDIKVGDVIEAYEMEETKTEL
ncbi:MAG: translation initiation factor IF-2 [Desulfuromonadaceae bacterium]|nr:translation initiation factor IF-2 [Desulfuromonadaceae bacterium]